MAPLLIQISRGVNLIRNQKSGGGNKILPLLIIWHKLSGFLKPKLLHFHNFEFINRVDGVK